MRERCECLLKLVVPTRRHSRRAPIRRLALTSARRAIDQSSRPSGIAKSSHATTGRGEEVFTRRSGFNFRQWVQNYTTGVNRKDWTAIAELRHIGFRSGHSAHTSARTSSFLVRSDLLGYINFKLPIIEAIASSGFFSSDLVCKGCSTASIGSNIGFLEAYLAAQHDASMRAYDIAWSYGCRSIHSSPMLINYFDGQHIPGGPKASTAYYSSRSSTTRPITHLLYYARRIRSHVRQFSCWRIEIPGDERLSARNRQHEPNGIFRTDTQWKRMFRTHLTSFVLLGSDLVRLVLFNARAADVYELCSCRHDNVVTLTPSTGAWRMAQSRGCLSSRWRLSRGRMQRLLVWAGIKLDGSIVTEYSRDGATRVFSQDSGVKLHARSIGPGGVLGARLGREWANARTQEAAPERQPWCQQAVWKRRPMVGRPTCFACSEYKRGSTRCPGCET